MRYNTSVYDICKLDNTGPGCQRLYDEYKKTFEDYISSKNDETLLQELVKRWNAHKVMTRWFSRFFHYLDRYFIAKRKLPSLSAIGLLTFYELVYDEMNVRVGDSVISVLLE